MLAGIEQQLFRELFRCVSCGLFGENGNHQTFKGDEHSILEFFFFFFFGGGIRNKSFLKKFYLPINRA